MPTTAISKDTKVTLGALIAAAGVILGSFAMLDKRFETAAEELGGLREDLSAQSSELSEIKFSLRELDRRVGDLRDSSAGYVSRDRVDSWIELFKAKNPALDVPPFP